MRRLGLLAVTVLVSLSGCGLPFLGRVMVTTPGELNPFPISQTASPQTRALLGIDQQFGVEVGPPKARLSVSVVEPDDFRTPQATVLVLHGIWINSTTMLGTAHRLAGDGFRVVLVDLRGHGRSSGEGLTYGQREARDVSQVIDELERRKLVAGRLGVYGLSYGATTAIHVAGIDPRIDAVVSVAPFSTMRDVVPDFGRTLLPGVERFIDDETIQSAIDDAGQISGFDPDQSSAIKAIQRTKAPVLIVHGEADWMVPTYHALRLYEAGKHHTKLVLVPMTGHVLAWVDPSGNIAQEASDWFRKRLVLGSGYSHVD
jgi:pimeloyl-ACP methyl ester carboxylesterase